MKYVFMLFVVFTLNSQAQLKNYIIGVKGDTLNRVDAKGMKQGPWVIHIDDLRGERGYEEEGLYKDDRKDGVWRRFSLEGDLLAIEQYRYGFKNGKNVYYNNMGDLLREENWRAVDPKNPYDTVNVYDVADPTKVLRREVIKLEPNSYKNGTWTYYNPSTGTIEKTEEWVLDKPKEKDITANGLEPIDPGTGSSANKAKKTVQKPKEVLDFEKKNTGKKKIKIRDGSTGG